VVSRPAQGLVADGVPAGLQYITLLTHFWITIPNRLIPMANPESSDSPQVNLFLECSRGFQKNDLGAMAKSLHKDCRYIAYPRSLGKPDQTKEEWLEQWAAVVSLWTGELEVSYIAVVSQPPFVATKSLPQHTFRFIVDIPGKLIFHVRIYNLRIHLIHLCDMVPTPQVNNKVMTSIGVEMNHESIYIAHIITDEDGSLKVKQLEEFTDSKVEYDFVQAMVAAGVKK
jgi:hypothetical protein